MGFGGTVDDVVAGAKDFKNADEAISALRAAAKTTEEFDKALDALKAARGADAAAFDAAKGSFKLDEGLTNQLLKDAKTGGDGLESHPLTDVSTLSKSKTAVSDGLKSTADASAQMAKDVGKACKENPKTCLGAVLGTAAAAYAADSYYKAAKYVGQITDIEPDTDGGVLGFGGTPVAKVTYKDPVKILISDQVVFSGTDCSPSIDGARSVQKVASETEVWIKLDNALSAPGSKGTFKISTDAVDRLGDAVGKGAAAAGNAAGSAAGGALGGLTGFLKGFTQGAGLWIVLCIFVLFFAFIIFKFIL
jgi:hypothetical protein